VAKTEPFVGSPKREARSLFGETWWVGLRCSGAVRSVADPVTGGRVRGPWPGRCPALSLSLALPLTLSLSPFLSLVLRDAPRRRFALSRASRGPRITCPPEHGTSRHGGRAVHGIVPPAFESGWAQCRVGLPREWPSGEVRHSHQEGRRDARRWLMSPENWERFTPPQGGEPERRRDERRTRRKAGASEKLAQGRCWFSDMASSVTDPVTGSRSRSRGRGPDRPPPVRRYSPNFSTRYRKAL
jgi:hypothetical protein